MFSLVTADGTSELPSDRSQWTLQQAFDQIHRPRLIQQRISAATIGDYETYVRRWQEFWASASAGSSPLEQKYRIVYPVLATVNSRHLSLWRDHVLTDPTVKGKNRNRTANKHVGGIQAILRTAAEEAIITAVPPLKRLDESWSGYKLFLDRDEVSRLYRACDAATWPNTLPYSAAVGWRAAIVWWCHYGMRTQELIRYESRHTTLTRAGITESGTEAAPVRSPCPIGKAVCEYGWFSYTPQKQKRKKPQPLFLPLNEVTRRHIEPILAAGGNVGDPVFNWPMSNQSFYDQWRLLCAEAEIAPRGDASQGYEIKHLRKTCHTWHADHSGEAVADQITGHAARSVSAKHYRNFESQVLEAILTLPQPAAFLDLP